MVLKWEAKRPIYQCVVNVFAPGLCLLIGGDDDVADTIADVREHCDTCSEHSKKTGLTFTLLSRHSR